MSLSVFECFGIVRHNFIVHLVACFNYFCVCHRVKVHFLVLLIVFGRHKVPYAAPVADNVVKHFFNKSIGNIVDKAETADDHEEFKLGLGEGADLGVFNKGMEVNVKIS